MPRSLADAIFGILTSVPFLRRVALKRDQNVGRKDAKDAIKPRAERSDVLLLRPPARPEHSAIVPQAVQSQSILFRLPAELREMIYQEATCGHVIHLKAPSKTHHREPKKVLEAYQCMTPDGWKCGCGGFGTCPRVVGFLALLMACRQIYYEASPILYSANTFCMTMDALAPSQAHIFLPDILLPECFNAIKALHLFHRLAVPPTGSYCAHANRDWGLAWNTIATMKSLQHLRIDIVEKSSPTYEDRLRVRWQWLSMEGAILRVAEVHAEKMELRTFEMVMPYAESWNEFKIGGRVYRLGTPMVPGG